MVEGCENCGLVVVDVVTRRPREALLRRRRQRPVPLDGRTFAGLLGDQRLGGAVAEGLVAAAVRVVVGRDRIQVQVREIVAEVPGPNARHAERGQRLHLVEAELQTLGVRDRIDVLVDRTGAVPRHQQRHALVQVVNHLRVPAEEHAEHGLGGLVHLLVCIAVDVHVRVFGPVRRRLARQAGEIGLALQIAVEPLHLLVATVGVRHRVDQHHHVLADAADHRHVGNGQPVRQLEHRLGGTGLVRMQSGVQVVHGARTGHQLLGLLLASVLRGSASAAVAALSCSSCWMPCLVGDGEQDDVAPLFGAPDGEHAHPRRGRRERAAVGVGGGRVHQFARRAGQTVSGPQLLGDLRGGQPQLSQPQIAETRSAESCAGLAWAPRNDPPTRLVPSARQRASQRRAVRSVIPAASAASITDHPASIRSTSKRAAIRTGPRVSVQLHPVSSLGLVASTPISLQGAPDELTDERS